MKLKKLFSVLLTLALLASLLCAAAAPAATAVSDWDALSAALAKGGDVKLTADVISPETRTSLLVVPEGVTATLDLNGFTLDGGAQGEENCIIQVNGSLTLADSSAGGTGRITGRNEGVDVIGGAFVMTGGTIEGCVNAGVIAVGGSVKMSGGTITAIELYIDEDDSVSGGIGVAAVDGASFEMTGGLLYDNVVGIYIDDGSAVMSGGKISKSNSAVAPDGGYVGGDGVAVFSGSFTLTGGEISEDVCGIIAYYDSVVKISGGSITGASYSAVDMNGDSELTIEGSPLITSYDVAISLQPGKLLNIGGPFTPVEPVKVLVGELYLNGGTEAPVTAGLPGNASLESIAYDGNYYRIVEGDNGEAKAVYVQFFSDVKGDEWYALAVSYAGVHGLFEGTDKGFEPDLQMTKAMAVQVLWNYLEKPASKAAIPFGDVAADAWYADAVRWAVEAGVVDAAANFEPNQLVTREDFAVLCYRMEQSLGKGFQGLWSFRLDFEDVGEISEDAVEAMSWCVMNGIIIGVADGVLAPQHTITRAQAAMMLRRL